jgi:hypothetical protein
MVLNIESMLRRDGVYQLAQYHDCSLPQLMIWQGSILETNHAAASKYSCFENSLLQM